MKSVCHIRGKIVLTVKSNENTHLCGSYRNDMVENEKGKKNLFTLYPHVHILSHILKKRHTSKLQKGEKKKKSKHTYKHNSKHNVLVF